MRRQVAAALERVRSETQRHRRSMVGYPEYADDAHLQRRRADSRRQRCSRTTASRSCRTTACSTRSATSSRGRRPASSSCNGIRVGDADLRGHLGAESRARRAGRAARSCSSSSTARRTRCSYQAASRRASCATRVRDTGLPVVYVNLLGGQDELVFDGGSFVMNAAGEVVQRAPPFIEAAVRGRYRSRSTARPCRDPGTSSRSCPKKRASTARSCSACATTWASIASRASCSACPAASIRR